jgi:hypothetical protein
MDELGIATRSLPTARPRGLVHLRPSKDGTIEVPLTNFTARIVRDVAEDDGVETRHVFEIEATLGKRVKKFVVPATQFPTMNWPLEHLGAVAIVSAGQGAKDHARAAIQHLSGEIPEEVTYTHCGWRQHGEEMIYLHAGGAIGRDGVVPGVRVNLPSR